MVRNLCIVKSSPPRPTRRARYRIGPRLLRRMPIAVATSSGESTRRARAATRISKRRLAIAGNPPHGHEDLGSVQAHLVAEGLGPVLQGLQGAGVRVLA